MAEGMNSSPGIQRGSVRGREYYTRGSNSCAHRSRPDDSHANCSRGLVTRPGNYWRSSWEASLCCAVSRYARTDFW